MTKIDTPAYKEEHWTSGYELTHMYV